jgi:uncharacterized Zn finger protein
VSGSGDHGTRGGWGGRSRWESFPPSKPIAVEGGLTTSRERGAIAESWWSKRFIAVLESFGLGGRMQRGRRYARSGQVLSLDVTPGLITSVVQGSRPAPYLVSIRVEEPTEHQWSQLDTAMQQRVGFVAQLLSGEVPADLEEAFGSVGVSLFPRSWRDVDSSCSCPDHENPCKHIAAVLYLFADHLDADPWLLLVWRGRTRGQVLGHLVMNTTTGGAAEAAAEVAAWWPLVPGTLRTDSQAVLNFGEVTVPAIESPKDPAAVLHRLGGLSTTRPATNLVERLDPLYRSILERA